MKTILLLFIGAVLMVIAFKQPGEDVMTTSQRIIGSITGGEGNVIAKVEEKLTKIPYPDGSAEPPDVGIREVPSRVVEQEPLPPPEVVAKVEEKLDPPIELPESLPPRKVESEDGLPAIQALYREASRLLAEE